MSVKMVEFHFGCPSMIRFSLFACATLAAIGSLLAAPIPTEKSKPIGILVLDDCDPVFKDKTEYTDNLTLLDSGGKKSFRVSGFNTAQSVCSCHCIATDPARDCIWVIEHGANRLRRFDRTGEVTLTVADVSATAIAVDPETGHVWALVGTGTEVSSKVSVFDGKGKEVAKHDIQGCDIAYDRKAKAFWIAGKDLSKIDAAKGKVLFTSTITTWGAATVDVDPVNGAAWIAVRKHPDMKQSENRLLKFDGVGKELASIDLADKIPFRISVDSKDGSIWLANLRKSVLHYSKDGKLNAEHVIGALAVQVDPAGGDAWVVTESDVQKMNPKGVVTSKLAHAGKTSQVWIAILE
jgi:DNA-binding beta-propeller fold protein YncE